MRHRAPRVRPWTYPRRTLPQRDRLDPRRHPRLLDHVRDRRRDLPQHRAVRDFRRGISDVGGAADRRHEAGESRPIAAMSVVTWLILTIALARGGQATPP